MSNLVQHAETAILPLVEAMLEAREEQQEKEAA